MFIVAQAPRPCGHAAKKLSTGGAPVPRILDRHPQQPRLTFERIALGAPFMTNFRS